MQSSNWFFSTDQVKSVPTTKKRCNKTGGKIVYISHLQFITQESDLNTNKLLLHVVSKYTID